MNFLLEYVLDFLFPPTKEYLRLHEMSREDVVRLPPALPTPFTFITSLFSYKDPFVKELVQSIKNKKDRHALECASFALNARLLEMGTDKALLLPIPLSRKRRNERGYNQCELIIDEMCKLNSNFEKRFDVLKRAKDTGEQKLKNRAERLESTGLFSVVPFETDLPIIIIDDVVTTGGTLQEAREALLRSGLKNVQALTLAH
jgi:ComF family protein